MVEFEFVRTEEFDETVEDFKRMFEFLKNPINLFSVLFGLGFWFTVYICAIIVVDTLRG